MGPGGGLGPALGGSGSTVPCGESGDVFSEKCEKNPLCGIGKFVGGILEDPRVKPYVGKIAHSGIDFLEDKW